MQLALLRVKGMLHDDNRQFASAAPDHFALFASDRFVPIPQSLISDDVDRSQQFSFATCEGFLMGAWRKAAERLLPERGALLRDVRSFRGFVGSRGRFHVRFCCGQAPWRRALLTEPARTSQSRPCCRETGGLAAEGPASRRGLSNRECRGGLWRRRPVAASPSLGWDKILTGAY
jgi:hypothetical protein